MVLSEPWERLHWVPVCPERQREFMLLEVPSCWEKFDSLMLDHRQAPGFEPGDIVTAIVNVHDGTATFSKKRVVQVLLVANRLAKASD